MNAFDTDDFPERDRLAILHDVFAREFMRVELGRIDPQARFRQRIELRSLPGMVLPRARSTPLSFRRGRTMLADGKEDIALVLVHSGVARFEQLGRSVVARRGEAFFWGTHVVGAGASSRGYDCTTIALPRTALAGRVDDPEAALARTVPSDTPALKLLVSYLGWVTQHGALEGPVAELAARHVADLVAVLCGARAEGAARQGVRAARLRAVKADLRVHLADPELSIHAVAARQGLSPNAIGALFREEGTTLTAFVRRARLRLARARLADARCARIAISEIAYDAGFNDVSYFNRAFRREFGVAPSSMRGAE